MAGPDPRRSGNPAKAAAAAAEAASAPRRRGGAREFRPWMLVAFLALGVVVIGALFGVGYASKFHREWGQWPWAKSAVPPKVYYDKHEYTHEASSNVVPAGAIQVARTPGGGAILATTKATSPAPPTLWIRASTHPDGWAEYGLAGSP